MNDRTNPPSWARPLADNSWRLLVYVQPGAKKNEVAGEMDGRLRLRIAAQAVDNKANKALMAFVAALLGVRPNRVSLEAGDTSRKKTLRVFDLPEFDWNALGVPDVPS
ncbi:MAG: DUF167 domain-containing protein [Deltaproteobacteria bacterium]|nr:DUF167 domain-containing protein [Deltaproteobacteria bacterium]